MANLQAQLRTKLAGPFAVFGKIPTLFITTAFRPNSFETLQTPEIFASA